MKKKSTKKTSTRPALTTFKARSIIRARRRGESITGLAADIGITPLALRSALGTWALNHAEVA